jgi:Fe2+ or Zn2+ uptake regulation protein
MAVPATDPAPLRRLGLRATAPRLAVLAMLAELGGHRSADDLVAALREAGYPHARTTVFNALQDLARTGLLRTAPVAAGALRYEADTSPHHHFVCRSCGLIVNVPISAAVRVPLYRGVNGTVDGVDVVYRGLCQQCSSAGARVQTTVRVPEHREEPVAVVRGEASDRL